MTRTSRARCLLASALTVCLAAVLPWSVGAWATDPDAEPTARPVDSVRPAGTVGAARDLAGVSVTLLTGDRVSFGPAVDGEPQILFHPRDPESPSGFSVRRDGEDVFVIPSDVASLVPGALARELFNVTALAEMEYDDAGRTSLPLIVEHHGAARALANATPLRITEQLESIEATAVTLDKGRAIELGQWLVEAESAQHGSLARATGGIEKIWLDGQVTGSALDGYLTDIDAPAAWDLGLDGTGVQLAVLDTGVDAEHPALGGTVEEQHDFTGTASGALDDNGHGTHVASLALGNGAGSDGARQGVAAGADLLAGKVLDADAKGLESWVIAGMEWAAASGADVVNLSLGALPSGPGDPLVEALERLTAQHDMLFAVAAGNRGGGVWDNSFTINSPGVAPSAVTVAAVGPDGRQASFSSEGPAAWSYGLKPDLSAPGVEILGARAGARDGDLYTPMSGTSMATPIVAGAAALLREQHPDWTADQVKAALVGTTDAGWSWDGVWKQGSGRLDLAAATGGELRADLTNFDFGYLEHPDDAVRTRVVTLTNTGDEAVSVHADDAMTSHTGRPAAEAAVTVDPATLTIPPGGSATATLTIDPEQLEDERWQGVVTFTEGDEELLRLPVGVYDEPPRYDLHVSALDTNGDPWDPSTGSGDPNVVGNVVAMNADTGGVYELWPDENGEATARVDPGHYSILAQVVTPARDGQPQITTLTGTAETLVDSDTSYVLDARAGVPLELPRIEGSDVEMSGPLAITYFRQADTGNYLTNGVSFTAEEVAAGQARVTPTAPVTKGSFEATARWHLEPESSGPGWQRRDRFELLQHEPVLSRDLTPRLSRRDVRRLARVEQVVHPVAREGQEMLMTGAATSDANAGYVLAEPVTPPVRRTVLMTAHPEVTWLHCLELEVNLWRDFCGPRRSFQAGSSTTVEIGDAVHASPEEARRGPRSLSASMGMSDGEHLSGIANLDLVESSSLRLTTPDGQVQATDGHDGFFSIPAGEVRLRLDHEWRMADLVRAAKTSRTTWEFTSAAPDLSQETGNTPPLLEVDYGPTVDDDGRVDRSGVMRFQLSFDRFEGRRRSTLERITEARLWWSADRGESWHRALVHRRGQTEFRAWVVGPRWRQGEDLSVRVRAVDDDGNSVERTDIGLLEIKR